MSLRVCSVLTILLPLIALAGYAAEPQPPLYVNIVMHNEEGTAYNTSAPVFQSERALLVAFASMLKSNNVMFNWESDWRFLAGVTNFDSGTASTGGSNVVVWLKGLGFELDPHAHETIETYADVAHRLQLCGVEPSGVVGGFIASPLASSVFDHVSHTVTGRVFPSVTWTPEILWGGGTGNHVSETSLWVSGIYRPWKAARYLRHSDYQANVITIGRYGGTKESKWDGLDRLLTLRDAGQLATNRMYTCALFISQSELTGAMIGEFEAQLRAHTNSPNIRWVGLTQAARIWRDTYGETPTVRPFALDGDFDEDGYIDGWEVTNHVGLTWNSQPNPGGHDVDDDGRADPVAYGAGLWTAWLSASGYAAVQAALSAPGPVPLAGDWDGDGRADPVLASSNGVWTVWPSSSNYAALAVSLSSFQGTPLLADFDGDGRSDPAAAGPGAWTLWLSDSGYAASSLALPGAAAGTPVAADFDGDGRADAALVSGGLWTAWLSTAGYLPAGPYAMSVSGGQPAAGDYDGDRRADPVMTAGSAWTAWLSSAGYTPSGPYTFSAAPGARPVP